MLKFWNVGVHVRDMVEGICVSYITSEIWKWFFFYFAFFSSEIDTRRLVFPPHDKKKSKNLLDLFMNFVFLHNSSHVYIMECMWVGNLVVVGIFGILYAIALENCICQPYIFSWTETRTFVLKFCI